LGLDRLKLKWIISLFGLCCGAQTFQYRTYAKHLIHRVNIINTVEYRMSQWLADNVREGRVMVPGSISFWLNTFSETPQLSGCCEQGVLVHEAQYAQYAIQTDDGAGNRAFPITLAWLQALGVQA